MAVQVCLSFMFVIASLFYSSSHGVQFKVGGRDGWIANPSENYNHWAERNRFQVNDTLYFKFKKGSDSVLVVTRENYNQCNTKNPIKSFTEGDSEYKFERSGPHYFISGNADLCNKGQKLIVVVLAVRPKKSPPAPTPKPAAGPGPGPAPPTPSVPTPVSPAPAPEPMADSPAPSKHNAAADFAPGLGRVIVGLLVGVGVIFGSLVGFI